MVIFAIVAMGLPEKRRNQRASSILSRWYRTSFSALLAFWAKEDVKDVGRSVADLARS
jgi:hypothetical protein